MRNGRIKKRITAALIACLSFLFALAPAAYAALIYFWSVADETANFPTVTPLIQFFAYGTGTETQPFGITEGKHFYNLSKLNSIGYLSARYYYEISPAITGTIDMSQMPAIAPIGSPEYPFYGIFNGHEKTVTGVTIASGKNDALNGWSEFDDIGVFGYIAAGAKIENLVLDEPKIISTTVDIGAEALLSGISATDFTISEANGRLEVTKAPGSTAPADSYFVFQTSNKLLMTVYASTGGYIAEGVAGASGNVELSVLVCRMADGVECARVIARYRVTVTSGAITARQAVTLEAHENKHIGLFAGHIEGSAGYISVYGGEISTSLAAHKSAIGLVGFVGKNATHLGNVNEYFGVGNTGDTAYLYADYLMGALNDPISWYGIEEFGEEPDLQYFTNNYLGGSVASANATTISFQGGRFIGGFGIFSLITDTSTATQVTRLAATNRSQFVFQGVYTVGASSTTRFTGETKYPDAGTTVNLSDAVTPYANDTEKNKYLRDQLLNTFAANDYNNYQYGERVQNFSYGFAFTNDLSNNNAVQRVHDYTGNYLSPAQSIGGASNEQLSFLLNPGSYYGSGSTPENPVWDTSAYIDIVIVAYTANAGKSNFLLGTNFVNKNSYTTLMSDMNNYTSSNYNIYVFRITYQSFNASNGRYIFFSSNGKNVNYPTTRYIFLSVGGQSDGSGGGDGEKGLVSRLDFVYKKNNQIVTLADPNYRYSRVVLEMDMPLLSEYSFYFNRAYYSDTNIIFTVNHTGGATVIQPDGSTGTVYIVPPDTPPDPP